MITPEQWELIEKDAKKIYSDLELKIIQEIAERIANVGYANTVVLNDVRILQEMGVLYSDIINLVAEETEKSYEEIKAIYEKAGYQSISYDDKIYKSAGLSPIPIKQSTGMLMLLEATAKKTNYNLNNLIMTTADTSQTQFYNAMNRAYMEVSTGVKSYSQAIIEVIEDVSKQGAYITYPSGARRTLESAVRTNIVTSVNQTCGKLQEMRADELGWDLMEITAKIGSRPSHAEWQGRVVSRSGQRGYLSLSDIGYGEITGFKGVNCGHDWRPYYKGSALTYTEKDLKEMKYATVTYNGKEMSIYDATQMQRKMERQINQDKKDLAGIQGILTSGTTDNKLITETKTAFARKSLIYKTHKNQLDDFLKQTEFRKDNTRLFIGKQDKSITTQVANVTKLANKYNNSDIIGTKVNGVTITEIGEHIISRTYARGIKFDDVEETLKKSVNYGTIKIDKNGKKSFQVYGKEVTISVNPDTGKTITVRKINKREKKKYGIEE